VYPPLSRILIVDDHEMIREGIRTLLASRPHLHICGEAVDGVDAIAKAKSLRPDVVLMDISMPRMDGLTATRVLKREMPGARVVIVTQNDGVEYRRAGIPADAYVLKVHLHRDLLPAIDRVLDGAAPDSTAARLDPVGAQGAGLLAAIVDSSDAAIMSKDLNGIVTSWNRSAEVLFGYTAAEMLGQPILRIIPPDHHEEEHAIMARIRSGERVEPFDTVRLRKDGTTVDCSVMVSPVKDADGMVIGASNLSRDITDRKRAEQALYDSEQRLRALADELENTVRARTHELERRNQEIIEQSEQLQELSSRLQQGQDAERRRIARELHDSAGQLLAVLRLNLDHVRDGVGSDHGVMSVIEQSEQLVDQLNSEIRTMSYLLHPPLLDESGLCGAAQWYARGLSERSGIDITVDISENFPRLPDDMELALFRIIQESLTNIHRHSGSKTARIGLVCDDDGVHLDVSDQGRGMPPERSVPRQRAGVGITGMRERVRQFGGSMAIHSSARGTTVSVSLPHPSHTTCDGSAGHAA
jgi:PAS domain S-box-containing protein